MSLLTLITLLLSFNSMELSGLVTDKDENALPGATILIKETGQAATANEEGIFSITIQEPGIYTLEIRFLGFTHKTKTVELRESKYLPIRMEPLTFEQDDVIVTTSPAGRNIRYQPANAYGLEALQDRQAPSFGEMLDGEPGIAMRSFGPAPSRPVIRGFDGDRLVILENGERMGDLSNTAHDHNISLDPMVAERVEVVRGPASLLYGSSALGGVVNIITSDIPAEWSRGSSGTAVLEGSSMNDGIAGFGRFQHGGENWAATGRFSYRGAGDVRTPDGRLPGTFIRNIEGGAGLGYRSSSFNGGLAFSAIDHNYGLPEEIDDPDEEAEIRMNQQTLQGRGRWSLNTSIDQVEFRFHGSRLFQQEIESEFEADGSVDEDIELEFEQYALNATLTARHRPLGVFDSGVFGIHTHLRNMDVGGEEAFTPGAINRSFALFTFQEIPLSNMTRLQFGVRGESQVMLTRPNNDFPEIDESETSTALSGSVGLNIRPASGLEIGVQLARAHRFPILEERFADGVHFGAGVYERGDSELNTEIGHGADFFLRWNKNHIHAELAGFYYRISDFVAFEPTGGIFTDDRGRDWDIFEYQARDAELLGGEAQLTVLFTEQFQVGGAADVVRGTRIDNDSPLPTMPPMRFRVQSRYDTGRWWVGGEVRFVGKQDRVVEQELPTDGYTLMNLNAGVRFDQSGNHRISLVVNNVTNILYRDHLSRIDRSEFGFPMPGRNVRVSYRYLF